MRLFDLHADIGYDIIQKKKQKITKDVIKNYHVEKFHKGEIAFICMASFFDGKETWDEMKDMILTDADTESFQQELFEAIYSVSECRTGK